MRCSKCGGLLHHLVTTVGGESLYQCRTGLTQSIFNRNNNRVVTGITPCELVHNNQGRLASGKYVYYTYHGDKLLPEAITLREGMIPKAV